MCRVCYENYGSPRIVNSRTLEAAANIKRVFEQSAVGGNLHIVVDDWNLDDDNLQYGIRNAKDDPDKEKGEVELACAELLMSMPMDERASAMAISEGWLNN